MLGVLFDGLAYGSLLFLVSLGLSVTMGLMNFVNLAHGAFAMAGGYARDIEDSVAIHANTLCTAREIWPDS